MENFNENYYEKRGVTKPSEIEEAYNYAKANNIQFYRCVSNSGLYYGWINDKYVKAAAGQEWFENPDYIAPEKVEFDEPSDDEEIEVVELVGELEKKEKIADEQTVDIADETAETAQEKPVDACAELKELFKKTQDEALKYATLYGEAKSELDAIKTTFSLIAKELNDSKSIGE